MKAKPKKGMKLHKFIATGGSPKNFKGAMSNAVVRAPKEKPYDLPRMGSK